MTKIVINTRYGGFSLSVAALEMYRELSGNESAYDRNIPRDDPFLIQIIEQLDHDADGSCAALKIVEIPDGVAWEIEEYDGKEHVAEQHRTWD